ncbi:PREDICTED: uncharacterized protein LOC108972405 isoform X2 [Bactrocera latifrons]|nr:PREDICTED: uncharacterized protein LOC108972405 isoform X2 [Bactrocera latifrons]
MLSFFSKKKQDTDFAEEAIQGPTDSTQSNEAQGIGMYPPIPPAFGMGRYPGQAVYPPMTNVASASDNVSPVPYVQGVPFELAPQLSSKSDFEVTQLQVDSILALLTRQMSVDENEEYNFALERSIQNECY